MTDLIELFASIVAVILVFVPHEFAHAFVAYKNGDLTAKLNGRLTLNPIKHIDPIGIVLCVFAGFGWAKPVPIYPYNFRNYRKGLFTTAIAGVVTNFIIAFIVFPLYLLISNYIVIKSSFVYYLVMFISTALYLTYLYCLQVFVFNLLPLYPLDGFRVVESATREVNPVRRFLKNYGYYILIALIIESFLCKVLIRYTNLTYVRYFDILGYYVSWFAVNIVGFPIWGLWKTIFGLPVIWPVLV